MIPCDSYYGSFRTRTFADVFGSAEEFIESFTECPLNTAEIQGILPKLFYLLYSRYGNSHIAFSDENQFKYSLYSTIWQYGPAWAKRVDIQEKLRALSEEELLIGGKAIHNHSFNPNTAPSTSTMEELLTINDQNTTNYKKSKLEAYGTLWELLDTDVTSEFLNQFKKLFIVVTAPDYPLYYTTEVE